MSKRNTPAFPGKPFGLLLVEGGDEEVLCKAIVEPAIWAELCCWKPEGGRDDLKRLARLAKLDPNFRHARSVGLV
jgi:hypothetical protein